MNSTINRDSSIRTVNCTDVQLDRESSFVVARKPAEPKSAWPRTLQGIPLTSVPKWKRALDVACIAITIPLLLPVSVLIALGVKAVSSGPILYSQERVGHSGRRFKCWKFRSMKAGADSYTHEDHTIQLMHSRRPWSKMDKKDPRVIPFGSLLRATGLDELPQLINVLRGDMSIVGPRPCTPYEFTHYLPWQGERLSALPGLTGLWQVNGRNLTTYETRLEHDSFYVRNWSIWLDWYILIKTFRVVVLCEGAY